MISRPIQTLVELVRVCIIQNICNVRKSPVIYGQSAGFALRNPLISNLNGEGGGKSKSYQRERRERNPLNLLENPQMRGYVRVLPPELAI
jgi:hypothetical protein